MKVAIYSLYKAYNKWYISMQEIDDFINYFTYNNQKLEYEKNQKLLNTNNYRHQEESKFNNYKYDCPPCDEYYIPENKKIKKLNMGYMPNTDSYYQNNETENNINTKQ